MLPEALHALWVSHGWARWLDGSYTPSVRWSPEADRDYFRQVCIIREATAERGWLGRRQYGYDPYWGSAL